MMETFAAIVVAVVVLPAAIVGILLLPALLAFICSFLSTWAAARWRPSGGPE
jgi:hypothetical protein